MTVSYRQLSIASSGIWKLFSGVRDKLASVDAQGLGQPADRFERRGAVVPAAFQVTNVAGGAVDAAGKFGLGDAGPVADAAKIGAKDFGDVGHGCIVET